MGSFLLFIFSKAFLVGKDKQDNIFNGGIKICDTCKHDFTINLVIQVGDKTVGNAKIINGTFCNLYHKTNISKNFSEHGYIMTDVSLKSMCGFKKNRIMVWSFI